jgi:hypothetical protein
MNKSIASKQESDSETLQKSLHEFVIEKETNLLNSLDINKTNTRKNIKSILNTSVLICPSYLNTPGLNKSSSSSSSKEWVSWPHALVAFFTEKCADIGNMESFGSLWRLIELDDSNNKSKKTRVLIQSHEIGEIKKYISKNLELTELKSNAAIWEISIIERSDSHFNNNNGITVDFKLIGSTISLTTENNGMYLVSGTSDFSQKGVAVLSKNQINESGKTLS